MSLETNVIKEIHPGVFWCLLEHPTSRMLPTLLDDSCRYVLVHNHTVGDYTWKPYSLPLLTDNVAHDVTSRVIRFDFIVPTPVFREMLSGVAPGIHVIQLNEIPPDYFDLDTVRGKPKYEILGKCGWRFEFDVPGNDYGQIASPDKQFLVDLLHTLELETQTAA